MGVSTNVSSDGSTLTIGVKGRFDFGLHQEFRRSYSTIEPRPRRVVIDLSETEYVDSSALGMLLLLKQDVGGGTADVTLSRPRPEVAKILAVANFQKLFKMT